mmetsp:Transcript_54924/g.111624  ORF Transcript_54924/g.111624 Transcript_54924/m.111624 type:complete len:207 (+) Transcript_54924:636-1256(+)
MGLLGLIRSGNLSCANCPDRFVGNDNLAPVLWLQLLDHRIQHPLVHLVGLAGLPLFQQLPNGQNNLESSCKSLGHLLGNILVGLTVLRATLRVAQQSPLDSSVLELCGTDLTGEGTFSCLAAVLGTGRDAQLLHGQLHLQQVRHHWACKNIDLPLVEWNLVLPIPDELEGLLKRLGVALPVSTDNWLPRHGSDRESTTRKAETAGL